MLLKNEVDIFFLLETTEFKFVLLLSMLIAIAALIKSMLQDEVFYVTTHVQKNNKHVVY